MAPALFRFFFQEPVAFLGDPGEKLFVILLVRSVISFVFCPKSTFFLFFFSFFLGLLLQDGSVVVFFFIFKTGDLSRNLLLLPARSPAPKPLPFLFFLYRSFGLFGRGTGTPAMPGFSSEPTLTSYFF